MIVITPPNSIQLPNGIKSVFLAGSIEMGKATPWQHKLLNSLENWEGIILNPRRENWDASWKQTIQDRYFRKQVEWELEGLEKVDKIMVYFDPDTKSPITLLELGLHARSGKLIVCCPNGFWRKGNVDIVCQYYGIPQVENLEALIKTVLNM